LSVSMLSYVGIDPGLHTGIAVLQRDSRKVVYLAQHAGQREAVVIKLFQGIKNLGSPVIVTIEQAVIRGSASAKKHGAIENRAYGEFIYGFLFAEGYTVSMVTPMRWKGNTPKVVVHNRLLAKFDTGSWIPPDEVLKLLRGTKSSYEDAMDALGLANYASSERGA